MQFTIDRRKAVYAERAIRTIRRGLKQLYLLQLSTNIQTAVKQIVNSHNNTPSRRNPVLQDGTHASPKEVIEKVNVSNNMEVLLHQHRKNQYTTNLRKRIIHKKPKFKVGDTVRYLKRRSKFSKEASLMGNWSDKLYQIHSINTAHTFKPMHTYLLAELGMSRPCTDLPPMREDILKKARVNSNDTFIVEKVLQRKGNKALVKWADYDTPTWEPISAIPESLLPPPRKNKKNGRLTMHHRID